MSTAQILDEIDALLELPVLEEYDPSVEVCCQDYAERHGITSHMAGNRLEAGYKAGVLIRRMVRNPETHNPMRAYRKATPPVTLN